MYLIRFMHDAFDVHTLMDRMIMMVIICMETHLFFYNLILEIARKHTVCYSDIPKSVLMIKDNYTSLLNKSHI